MAEQRRREPEKMREKLYAWRRKNVEHLRRYHHQRAMAKKFGMDATLYRTLFQMQGGRCAICGEPETAKHNGRVKGLAVDHVHATGRIRGLLCGNCNNGLGRFMDSPARLRKAAQYLEEMGENG
jgi:hypothetical protein